MDTKKYEGINMFLSTFFVQYLDMYLTVYGISKYLSKK